MREQISARFSSPGIESPSDQTAKEAKKRKIVELIGTHEEKLSKLAKILCRGNEEEAKDLLQEMTVRALRAAESGTFDENKAHEGYFFAILRNCRRHAIEKQTRDRKHLKNDGIAVRTVGKKVFADPLFNIAPPLTPEAVTLQNEVKRRVTEALASLPEAVHALRDRTSRRHLSPDSIRKIAALYFLEKQSQQMIAATLGISARSVQGAIKDIASVLKKQLRDLL